MKATNIDVRGGHEIESPIPRHRPQTWLVPAVAWLPLTTDSGSM